MVDNQTFRKITDFIKSEYNVPHGEICNKIGLRRSKYDNLRRGLSSPNEDIIKSIISNYPEAEDFTDNLLISVNPSKKVNTNDNAVLIEMSEQLKFLREELSIEKKKRTELRKGVERIMEYVESKMDPIEVQTIKEAFYKSIGIK